MAMPHPSINAAGWGNVSLALRVRPLTEAALTRARIRTERASLHLDVVTITGACADLASHLPREQRQVRTASDMRTCQLRGASRREAGSYWRQGDVSLYSSDVLGLRMALRHAPQVGEALEAWWIVARTSLGGDAAGVGTVPTISREQYLSAYSRIYQVLIGGTGFHARACGEAEWRYDSRGLPSLTREMWLDALFALADTWTRTCEADEYEDFLRSLLARVAPSGWLWTATKVPRGEPASASDWSYSASHGAAVPQEVQTKMSRRRAHRGCSSPPEGQRWRWSDDSMSGPTVHVPAARRTVSSPRIWRPSGLPPQQAESEFLRRRGAARKPVIPSTRARTRWMRLRIQVLNPIIQRHAHARYRWLRAIQLARKHARCALGDTMNKACRLPVWSSPALPSRRTLQSVGTESLPRRLAPCLPHNRSHAAWRAERGALLDGNICAGTGEGPSPRNMVCSYWSLDTHPSERSAADVPPLSLSEMAAARLSRTPPSIRKARYTTRTVDSPGRTAANRQALAIAQAIEAAERDC